MGIGHYIDIELNSEFSKAAVRTLLQRSLDCGVLYQDYNYLNVDDALVKLFNQIDSKKERHSYLSVIVEDTLFNLWIFPSERNFLTISMGDPCPKWKKNFYGSGEWYYSFDFARYMRLLLNISTDFTIKEFKVYNDLDTTYEIKLDAHEIYIQTSMETNRTDVTRSLSTLNINAQFTQFELYEDVAFLLKTDFCETNVINKIKSGRSVIFYTKVPIISYMKDQYAFMKITLECSKSQNQIKVQPLEPYVLKKGFGQDISTLDLEFYIKKALDLMNDFPIHEMGNSLLRTNS